MSSWRFVRWWPLLHAGPMRGFLLLVCQFFTDAVDQCSRDEDCNLNGQCLSNKTCSCYAPWGGPDCGVLQFLPAPTTGAYGDQPAPRNVTSWGGNAVYDDTANQSLWHGFFTEIGGQGCGLSQWRAQSTVVHAVAQLPEGPYTRVGAAPPVLPHEAHNPQVFRLNSSHWYIFHIGDADARGSLKACPNNIGPPKPAGHMPPTKLPIHVSKTGPSGPFLPVAMRGSFGQGCNNPSPFQHPNGTIYLACTWSLRRADSVEGPWSSDWTLAPKKAKGREWQGRFWEDCFLWIDARGHWHLLAHTYVNEPWPAQSISGHGFSRDGHHWTYSRTEPYSATVHRSDGSVKNYSTMERPKLVVEATIFDSKLFADSTEPMRPTHLLNGASPVWDESTAGGNPGNPCGACEGGDCVKCKVQSGRDWTYTIVRPLVAPTPSV